MSCNILSIKVLISLCRPIYFAILLGISSSFVVDRGFEPWVGQTKVYISCKSKDKTSSFTIGTIHSIHYFHNVFLSMVARYILIQGCHTQKNHQILLQCICVQDCYNTFVFAIFNDMFCGNYLAILYGNAFWQSLHQSLVAILNTYVL
jgi:hypothetical protein